MTEAIQELKLGTPGFSPKKIYKSSVANGFNVEEQRKVIKSSNSKVNGNAVTNGNALKSKTDEKNHVNGINTGNEKGKLTVSVKEEHKYTEAEAIKEETNKVMLNVEINLIPIDPRLITSSILSGSIPVLSHKTAALCMVLNCLCPGSGTIVSGLMVLACCRCSSQKYIGCPRWHQESDSFDRLCCVLVNILVCLAQIVTVPLCLVGWCWSVGWGISMVNIANRQLKYEAAYTTKKRAQEQSNEGNNNSIAPTLKLDVMSLEGQESF